MFDKLSNILSKFKYSPEYRPALRYAFGSSLIMALVMLTGAELGYIIPMLALNFLGPGSVQPGVKQSVGFVLIVAASSIFAYIFTAFFYDYMLIYIPLLALILIWVYYTTAISMVTKLFLLISLLASPVPIPWMDIKTWSFILAGTLTTGAVFTIIVVWIVFALFPDRKMDKPGQKVKKTLPANSVPKDIRLQNALKIFLVTFPVVLLFIFFQGGNALLVLIYIVILAMLPRSAGRMAGKGKIYGNIIGGLVTIFFYEILTIVPNFFFFIMLFLGTALLFSEIVFAGKSYSVLFKTGFSTLTLIIGSTTNSTDNAANEIWLRIFQVMLAVIYVVGAYYILDAFMLKQLHRHERFYNRKIVTKT
jgi:hypothetical protein